MRLTLVVMIATLAPVCAQSVPQDVQRLRDATQAVIDQAIKNADKVIVEAVEGPTKRVPLWESSEGKDVRALDGAFRAVLPETRIIDGKVSTVVDMCRCYGQLWLTLKKGDEVLLSLLIKHGTSVGGEDLPLRHVKVDEAALAPFYKGMMELVKRRGPSAHAEPVHDGVPPMLRRRESK